MDLIQKANQYENLSMRNLTTSDRIKACKLGKKIVLTINEIYKQTKNPKLMEVMKAVTQKKRKIDKRLKGKPDLL
ncbi:hypothetical protein [Aquimarina agarivorans]|uniref:hypothetical protein n=1 Tax=Aquimarina agarivorans TaxID=980584 RepID=UPI000248FB0C|nr:hypothetical protein [Aquimarina agarivorans]